MYNSVSASFPSYLANVCQKYDNRKTSHAYGLFVTIIIADSMNLYHYGWVRVRTDVLAASARYEEQIGITQFVSAIWGQTGDQKSKLQVATENN